MNRPHLLRLALPAALVLAAAAPARGQTWTGNGSGSWNDAADWSPAAVPNSPTATVNFPGFGPAFISSSVQAQSLTFSNPTGAFSLVTTASQTLSSLTAINMTAGVTGTDNINLANVSTGNLLFAAGNNLTITNNSTAGGMLNIGQASPINTVIGTPGSGGVIFAGPGTTAFYGSFAVTGGNEVIGGLTKTGPGELSYAGDGSNLNGGLTLNGGTMTLNYYSPPSPYPPASPNTKLATGVLTLDGGILTLFPTQGTTFTQTIPGGTVVNAGHTDVNVIPTGTITLAAGAITHNVGGTVDFSPAERRRVDD